MKVVCLLLALFALAAADPYYIPNTDEYFDRPAESLDDLERMGIDTASLHPDIAEDARLLVPALVAKYGFNVETHHVTTEDGYILEMHRITGGPECPPSPNKPVVFLQHGLLDSSATWVIMGPNNGFGYLMANSGYDVWMGNARGNRYSRSHISLNPNRRRFWDFSWHEIGVYDLPAMFDYVTEQTSQTRFQYVGHSQGTTAFFAMAAERPEYNDRIISMQALAPVAFMSNLRSPGVRMAAAFLNTLDLLTSVFGIHEFLPNSAVLSIFGSAACRDAAFTQAVCNNILFLIAGFNEDQMNSTMLPVLLGHTPAGASTNQLVHYGQGIRSGRFRLYDLGFASNLIRYGSRNPPNYDLSKISAPVALHYSLNDWMAEPIDVYELEAGLGNSVGLFQVPMAEFNHLDFVWAIDAKTLLWDRVLENMRSFEN